MYQFGKWEMIKVITELCLWAKHDDIFLVRGVVLLLSTTTQGISSKPVHSPTPTRAHPLQPSVHTNIWFSISAWMAPCLPHNSSRTLKIMWCLLLHNRPSRFHHHCFVQGDLQDTSCFILKKHMLANLGPAQGFFHFFTFDHQFNSFYGRMKLILQRKKIFKKTLKSLFVENHEQRLMFR